MESKKNNKKQVKNSICNPYYIAIILLSINTIFIIIGYKIGIDLLMPLIIEMILFNIFIIAWFKSYKQNVKNSIRLQMYIAIIIVVIHMLLNIIIYAINPISYAIITLKKLIESFIFIIVLIFIIRYKGELKNIKSPNGQTNLDKPFDLLCAIIIIVWYVFIFIN